MGLDAEPCQSGELVDSQKLIDPTAAKTVRFVDSKAVPTDGPFAEVNESLARLLDHRGHRGPSP
jgi:hypothetical protein